MKLLKNHFVNGLVLSICLIGLFASCFNSPTTANGGTTETTSANIVGKVRNENGAPVKGATVRLIPLTYAPSSSDSASIDSVYTDENGSYSFGLKSSGFFNITAQNNAKYAFKDSVYGNKTQKTILDDDTLRDPGSLSGTIEMGSGLDYRQVYILILGTNNYTQPSDTSGKFTFSSLAKGNYHVRILTASKDYAVWDSSVVIESRKYTVISETIKLKNEGIPAIENVTAHYDSQMVQITLSWKPCDTSLISSYYVFRNSDVSKTPLAIVSKKDSSFVDNIISDSLRYGIDSFQYTIAALGKNLVLGKSSTVSIQLGNCILKLVDSISIVKLNKEPWTAYSVDISKSIYIAGNGPIIKIDSVGNVLKSYGESVDSTGATVQNSSAIKTDGHGNVYILNSYPQQRITRLTSDLKFVSQDTIPDTNYSNTNICMAANRNGFICHFGNNGTAWTYITVFDSTLTVKQRLSKNDFIISAQIVDDTIYTLSETRLTVYDLEFNEIKRWAINDDIKDYWIKNYQSSIYSFSINRNGVSVFCTQEIKNPMLIDDIIDNNLVILFDSHKKYLGRCAIKGRIIGFGEDNRLYWSNEKGEIYIYNINL